MPATFPHLDKPTLRDLLRGTDEVAAVYLGAPPAVPTQYEPDWATRWGPMATALRDHGADRRTIVVLEQAVLPFVPSRTARAATEVAAFAAGDRLLGVFPAPGGSWPDTVALTAPAHLYPLLEWVQQHPAYVDLVVDRAGADIAAHPGAGAPAITMSVEGPDDEIERPVPPGFLSQRRAERRAEDSWAHNARAVAERVAVALREMDARLLVVSGDGRAVRLTLERLPDRVVREVSVRQVTGGRSRDGSQHGRAAVAAGVAREAADHQRELLLWLFGEERAPGGRAVEGEDPTLAALAAGRVGTLLVVPQVADDPRRAWFGAAGTEVTAGTRPAPPWDERRHGPLLDVAVRAALMTGAEVRVVPTGQRAPAEGLGGLCRYR